MRDRFLTFGNNLQLLLGSAGDAVEITVPNRLTCLLALNYGRSGDGRTGITLTDMLVRKDHLDRMNSQDISRLGELHPDDKPTVTTTFFSCRWEDSGFIAEPVYFSDDAEAAYKEIVSEDGLTNVRLLQEVSADAERNFSRFHRMGFFGPKAVRTARTDIPFNPALLRVSIAVERRMTLALLELHREYHDREMNFLEECARRKRGH